MQRDGVEPLARALHQDFGPVQVAAVGAGRDADEFRVAVVASIGGVAAELVGVVFGAHVAVAPGFVAEAPELDAPRLLAAVLFTEFGHRTLHLGVQVLDPLGHLLHGAAADVAVDVRFRADEFAKTEKFMRAEGIVLGYAAPGVVHDARAFGTRPDAVAPVVAVGEAAAGPAEVRDPDPAKGVDHVLAHAVDVRDFGFFPDVQAVVDAVPEVF